MSKALKDTVHKHAYTHIVWYSTCLIVYLFSQSAIIRLEMLVRFQWMGHIFLLVFIAYTYSSRTAVHTVYIPSTKSYMNWTAQLLSCYCYVQSYIFFSWQQLKLNAQSFNLCRSIRFSAQYSNENITLKPVTFEPNRQ